MIKPEPYVYKCPSCKWEKVVAPKSDALTPGDYFESCPECGNMELKMEPLNYLYRLWFSLLGK